MRTPYVSLPSRRRGNRIAMVFPRSAVFRLATCYRVRRWCMILLPRVPIPRGGN